MIVFVLMADGKDVCIFRTMETAEEGLATLRECEEGREADLTIERCQVMDNGYLVKI
jgi:hypothetical protein